MESIAIVTGASAGIGIKTAQKLAEKGFRVISACRDVAKAQAAGEQMPADVRSRIEVMQMDLADLGSVSRFADTLSQKVSHINLLINNAGTWTTKLSKTRDQIETTLGVNHLGHFALTHELMPLIKNASQARIICLSSALHTRGRIDLSDMEFEKEKFNSMAAYSRSKLCNALFVTQLASLLPAQKVQVHSIHPGVVATELARDFPKILIKLFQLFMISPERGADTTIAAATSAQGGATTGQYWSSAKIARASAAARDPEQAKNLWDWSLERLKRAGWTPRSQ